MEPFPFNSDNFYECFVSIYKNAFLTIKKGFTAMFIKIAPNEEKETPTDINLKKKRA